MGPNSDLQLSHGLAGRQDGSEPPESRSGLVVGVLFCSLVFTAVTIAARVLIRKMMPPNRFFLDDGLVLVASILTICLCMVSLEGEWVGGGGPISVLCLVLAITDAAITRHETRAGQARSRPDRP